MDNDELIRTVEDITRNASLSKERQMRKHRKFATMYPKLFEMCMSKYFDAAQFKQMMNHLESVQNDRVTLECATSNVHGEWTQRYVVPLLSNPQSAGGNVGQVTIRSPDGTATDCTREALQAANIHRQQS
jgi:hypothetical protein